MKEPQKSEAAIEYERLESLLWKMRETIRNSDSDTSACGKRIRARAIRQETDALIEMADQWFLMSDYEQRAARKNTAARMESLKQGVPK